MIRKELEMELIKADTEERLSNIKNLYLASFPKEELKPFSMLIENSKAGKGDLFCIEENNKFLGHALVAYYKDMVLLDYFAVDENKRGEGIGGKAIALLLEKYADKRFFLEAETLSVPCGNIEQRRRRMNFYQRSGMVYNGLLVEVRGVAMDVLVPKKSDLTKVIIDFEEYREFYRNVFGEDIYMQVKLLEKRDIY